MDELNNTNIELPQVHEKSEEELLEMPITRLKPLHQRFVHLYLTGQYKVKELAELLNVSTYTVRAWLRKQEIKDIIEQTQQDEDDIVKQGLKALRMKALYKMSDLMDSEMDAIAYQAARDILDRTGHKGVEKKEVQVEVYTFEQQLKDIIKSNAIDIDYDDSVDK